MFHTVSDDLFKKLVLARVVESVSKADTIRVLGELGVQSPSLRTIWPTLEGGWRDAACKVAYAHASKGARLSLVLYARNHAIFRSRRGGRGAQSRDEQRATHRPTSCCRAARHPSGFPLDIHMFERTKAETLTLVPVLTSFQQRHEVADHVVVADAGMLLAANLSAIEDAGFWFIVGSRISKAPYDLAAYFERHGATFTNGQALETTGLMGTGATARERRIVYHYFVAAAQG